MKRNIVIAVVTAAALIGGGTATAIATSGDDDTPTTTHPVDTVGSDDDRRDDDRDDLDDLDDDAQALSAKVNAADAIAVALKHQPGTAVAVERDDDGADDDDRDHRGKAAWEVDVLGGGDTWYSVWIDPNTGEVLGSETDAEDDADEVRAALKGTSVTAEEAAEAAASKGTVTSVDLDDDTRGWEVETITSGDDDREWLVDLNRGKVTADEDDDRDDR
ncbi:PepSY domain-containing protein [Streptomyces sp. GD-15H]|uniref:PepSY domain-containing protein n=1 Tax=Streptomyces sp. GD-15H TaxID=3129112 RepID=UPI00324A7A1C